MNDARGWRLPLLLWFLAFSHRLFLLLGSIDRSWPFPIFYEGDAETFYNYAQAILQGSSYDAGVPFHPPLFPLFLALWHGLFGGAAPNPVLRILLAGIYALQAPLLFALLRRYLRPGEALAGSLLAVYSFGLSVISISAVSEGLYLLILLGALLLFHDLKAAPARSAVPSAQGRGAAGTSRRRRDREAVGLGILLGLCALTRAEGAAVAVVLLAWGCLSAWRWTRLHERGAFRAFFPWAIAAGCLLLVLIPWTVRNAVSLRGINRITSSEGLAPLPTFVVTTAYGPLNFALANHAGAPGYFTRSLLTSGLQKGVLDLRDPQHREVFLHGYRHGLDFIRSQPQAFADLVARKLAILGRTLFLGWTQWDLPGGLRGTRYPVDLFTPDSPAALFVHLALLLPGVWWLWRRGREEKGGGDPFTRGAREYLKLTGVLVLLTVATTALFFGYVRQGVLLLPLLFGIEGVTAAAAAGWLARRIPRRWSQPLKPLALSRALAVFILVLWLVEFAGAFQNRNYVATGETVAGSKMLNRDSVWHLEPTKEKPGRTP